jgi:uncharacterized protein
VFIVILTAMALSVSAVGSIAFAQETKSPSILEFLGFKPAKPKAVQKRASQKASLKKKGKVKKPTQGRKKAVSKNKPAEQTRPLAPAAAFDAIAPADIAGLPAVPDKLPDAKIILVVGDFMADGVSEGIEQAFEGDAGVVVVSKANGSSGFVRDDFYNWSQEIAGIVAETKPAVITVMIGTNDRQPMRLNGAKAVVRSPEWTAEYERRVAGFADAVKATGLPVVWIGMPPFKQPSMSADMLALNDIYRKNAERVSGTFVDIWDGFLDEQGAFSINGSDYIGQPVRLRASDGINLTFPGKRKTAFFAEKPIRLALGDVGIANSSAFNPFNLPGPKPLASTNPSVITHVAPVSLFDPAFDGDSELLGSNGIPTNSTGAKSAAQALYVDGIAPKPPVGRIDQINNPASVLTTTSPQVTNANTP